MEGLLAGAVDDEHAGHLALGAVAERVADAQEVVAAALAAGEEMRERIAEQTAARRPGCPATTSRNCWASSR
ncbi:hypothetical protein OG923_34640 (plasmid) [Streptomyces halstedii]|uniref:hypothetical protein n=1 Tax=Streptomyces halstedii TaxID=1944 RepID=UPI002F90B24B